MNQTKLSAYTPIYQLYDKRIITLKTYKWLNTIGVQNVEELAMAYQVVGKTQLYDALPKAFRTELRAITTQTLSKTTQNTLLMPSITLPVTTQMHLQQLFVLPLPVQLHIFLPLLQVVYRTFHLQLYAA